MQMYSIHKHIQAAKDKGEESVPEILEYILEQIGIDHEFQTDDTTLELLEELIEDQRELRDTYSRYSVDFQMEWGILCTMQNVRDLVKLSLEGNYEEFH